MKTKKCEVGRIGNPKFKYDDEVGFYLKPYGKTKEEFHIGKVYIVDAFGTFEQNREPSYDILVDKFSDTNAPMLVKHVRESECYKILDKEKDKIKDDDIER